MVMHTYYFLVDDPSDEIVIASNRGRLAQRGLCAAATVV
jgi:hypothetical protein